MTIIGSSTDRPLTGALHQQDPKDLGLVASGTQLYGVGNAGEGVRRVQERLIELGYLPAARADGRPNDDGIFGPRTEEALRRFQEEAGIAVDGVFGPESHAALFSEAAPSSPSATPSSDTFSRVHETLASFGRDFRSLAATPETEVREETASEIAADMQAFLPDLRAALLEISDANERAAQMQNAADLEELLGSVEEGYGIFTWSDLPDRELARIAEEIEQLRIGLAEGA